VQVQSGIVDVTADSTTTGDGTANSPFGTFAVSAGATLRFASSGHATLDGAAITGTGNVNVVYKGHLTILNNVNVVNLRDSTATIDGDGALNVSGLFTVTGKGTWTGGGSVHILAGATLDLKPTTTAGNTFSIGKNLINDGTVTWFGGNVTLLTGYTIQNNANKLFDIQAAGIINGGGTFINAGTLRKSQGNNNATLDIDYKETGGGHLQETDGHGHIIFTEKVSLLNDVLVVPGSGIAFNGGAELDGGTVTDGGAIAVAGNFLFNAGTFAMTAATLSADSFTVKPGAWFYGYGSVYADVVNEGEIDTVLDAPTPLYVYGDFTQYLGVINNIVSVTNIVGGTTLDVYAGANGGGNFVLRGGNVNDDNSATLNVAGAYEQYAGAFTASYADLASVRGAVTLNGGTFEMDYGGGLSSGGALAVNGGVFTLNYATASIGAAATVGDDNSGGGIAALDGATLNAVSVSVKSNGILTGTGSINASLTNAGEVDAATSGYGTLVVAGTFTQNSGVTNVSSTSSSNGWLVSGTITENGGAINLNGGGTIEADVNILLGAVFSGYGDVDGGVTNAGSINVFGPYYAYLDIYTFTQTDSGVLTLDLIYGYSGGLSVGTANLGGTLALNFTDGFTPEPGYYNIIPIEYNTRNGGFNFTPPPAPPGATWHTLYDDAHHMFEVWLQADGSGSGG
jgi:fibronectin-binding autotransporter adhesin